MGSYSVIRFTTSAAAIALGMSVNVAGAAAPSNIDYMRAPFDMRE